MKGAVTASTREAAQAGVAMLARGGNAVDAAVAAALATCVADPCNTGLAGYGGYLLAQRRGEAARCVQFPLCAPSCATPQSLARDYPEEGPGCSSVPNVVPGLARALADFGSRSWAEASAAALALAHDGVVANATNTRALALNRGRAFVAECFVLEEAGAGRVRFRQPRLARTLERMAEKGPEWFWQGPLAAMAQRAWSAAAVEVPEDDWREPGDAAQVVPAASFETHGVRIQAAPLGLSGSACLFATFAAAARIGKSFIAPAGLARLAAAMASIWQYRFAMPSGNDFDGIDATAWVEAALASPATARPAPTEAAHTAHINAMDAEGMLAALTFTHGPTWFGGRWALEDSGVIMNGGMRNFARSAPLARGARLFGVSNMTPSSATSSAGDCVAIGCPGARRIPSNIALALARHFIAGEALQPAVSGGRLHAESLDLVTFEEPRLGRDTRAALERHFARVEAEDSDNYFGPLTALRASASGDVEAAVDDRDWQGFSARRADCG
jgi:gamma-glutamyltranspeptidase/glutathione hydrolase